MINFFTTYSGVELLIISIAYIIAIVFALSIHEYSHSLVALTQGDYTSRNFGRLSLNPFKHIDPIGFLCLLLFGFGWAKPVPVNSLNFKNYRKGMFLTSIAGICANFICCFIFMGILTVAFPFTTLETMLSTNYLLQFLYMVIYFSATINLGLAIFNLLPIRQERVLKDLPDSPTLGGPADNGEIRTCGVFLKQSREHEARDRHADDGDEDRQEIDPAPAVQSRQNTKDQSKDQSADDSFNETDLIPFFNYFFHKLYTVYKCNCNPLFPN